MKRLISLLFVLLLATPAVVAQETKKDEFNTNKDLKTKLFVVQNRDPNTIAGAVRLLGSGFKGAELNTNQELRTITVRDFPENIAAIEDAIKRLDVPAAPAPDLELKISVLIGSKSPLSGASVPDDLKPVVQQLESTLSYAHYGLMTTTVHRTKTGNGIEGSGVAEPTLLGMKVEQARPIFYTYNLRSITVRETSLDVHNFQFSMRVPIDIGNGSIQYQNVGFETPVAVRQGEKVVIGTTTMGDKALIVVVAAKVNR
jgi:hypothetical protein